MLENTRAVCVFVLGALICFLRGADSHGRLMDPPSRSSLWRFKDDELIASSPRADEIKPNYNDNELFCGGAAFQQSMGGQCGVCGDSIAASQPRANEAGGTYGLGIISRKYIPGVKITVVVQITAQHLGYFEFRLCEWNDVNSIITQECLDKNLLETDQGWRYPNIDHTGYYNVQVKLPDGLECSQCVLQWKYNTGNSWGCFGDDCAVGNGPQEQFYGCADIAIGEGIVTPSIPPVTVSTSENAGRTNTIVPVYSKPTTEGNTVSTTTSTTTTHGPRPSFLCQDAVHGQWYELDCTHFYTCLEGYPTPTVMTCPEGLVYDALYHTCNYKSKVHPPCGTLQ